MGDKKLTICFFGEAKPEDIHAVKWIKFFVGKGHNVHLFSYSDFGKEKPAGIKLHLLKRRFPINVWPFNSIINLPLTLMWVKKMVKEIKPDIIHAHCVTSYGTLASLTKFHPFVLTAWGSDILVNPKENIVTKWATQHALKSADIVTCDAGHMKDEMVKLGADGSKINIIFFGVDTEKFSPGPKDAELIKKWGLTEKDDIVISLRSLKPIYNVETLIKAAPAVIKEVPNANFVIAGTGPEEEMLKSLAKELGVSNCVRFIGWVDKEDLPGHLRTGDIYVSTSLSDGGIASSTAEAMSCGLPAVITDFGENKDWVKDNESGFLFSLKDHNKLAELLIFLLKNKEKSLKMGESARKVIEEKNNYYREMGKMEEIYINLSKNYVSNM